jgi:type IV pilus assembly protein PilC
MLFSSRLPLPYLIDLCRTMRHNLDAGLTLVQIFQQQSQRGLAPIRPLAERVLRIIKRGHSLEVALEEERAVLPPLFLALVGVGERTGNLPEVLGALESFYRTQHRLKRELISRSLLPVLQFVAAIFVIAALIFILGWIAEANNTRPMDPLGVGLVGTSGAIIFLVLAFGSVGALIGGYWAAGKFLSGRAPIDRFLLHVPVVGGCLYALAVSRFCMAFHATLETAMPIDAALSLSLRATGNTAFAASEDVVLTGVRAGDDITDSLLRCGLFQPEFSAVLATAEQSGRMPEVMKHQAKHYAELAEERLVLLTRALGFLVWLFVAILIIIAIFRIFTTMYLGQLNQFTQ